MAVGQRTKGASATELMSIIAGLEKQVADNMLILAAIAFHQDDKVFEVIIEEIKAIPAGSSVDVAFYKPTQSYQFKYAPPGAPPLEPSLIEVPG